MTVSCTLSSCSPSSVGMTWGSCTAQCLWISLHFYVAAAPGSPVGPAPAALWSHMHWWGCYRPQGPLGCRSVMGIAKQCPGYGSSTQPRLLEHFMPVHGSLSGLWSFSNCSTRGPDHVTRSAHPGSTSLYPGRNQAATGIKAGGAAPTPRACKAHPLGTHFSCEGTLSSGERGWYLVKQGQDSIF